MRQEDIHALLGPPQRGSIAHFGNNEWRATTRHARRMAANLDIRRVKRARLRDNRDVEIANDMKLLRCGQRRPLNEIIDNVDPDADGSGYFLEDHVPAIETDAANRILVRQDKCRANVWMARKRHFRARRENTYASSVHRIGGEQNERCLGEVKLVGDGLHLSARKPACIGNHGHRVAAELPIGEDIDRLKWHFHKRNFLG